MGVAGIRGSIMAWRVFPYIWSRIFNLNGLAHKMVLDADYTASERLLYRSIGWGALTVGRPRHLCAAFVSEAIGNLCGVAVGIDEGEPADRG